MDVLPAVDVLGGRVVRLLRGDYDAVTEYGVDPGAAVRSWVAAGAELVHVVDLDGARSGHGDPGLWRELGDARVPFQAGGGLRTVADVTAAAVAGARRVVVGTAAIWEPATLAAMVRAVGADRVVAAVDVRGGRAVGAGWRDGGRALGEAIADVSAAGVRRLLVTGIAQDGTMEGPDLDLLERVQARAPEAAIIASGGVGSLADLRALAALGVEAVVVGRALYERVFTYEAAVAAASA